MLPRPPPSTLFPYTTLFRSLPPRLAPVSAGVFPLVNKDGLPERAGAIHANLRKRLAVFYDESGSIDRKSTRLNSSHGYISYAVFCLKKKKISIRYGTAN